jgi:hypothetical protein
MSAQCPGRAPRSGAHQSGQAELKSTRHAGIVASRRHDLQNVNNSVVGQFEIGISAWQSHRYHPQV